MNQLVNVQVEFYFVKSHFNKEKDICKQNGLSSSTEIENYLQLLYHALYKQNIQVIEKEKNKKSTGAFNNKCSVTVQKIEYSKDKYPTIEFLQQELNRIVKQAQLYTVTFPEVKYITKILNSDQNQQNSNGNNSNNNFQQNINQNFMSNNNPNIMNQQNIQNINRNMNGLATYQNSNNLFDNQMNRQNNINNPNLNAINSINNNLIPQVQQYYPQQPTNQQKNILQNGSNNNPQMQNPPTNTNNIHTNIFQLSTPTTDPKTNLITNINGNNDNTTKQLKQENEILIEENQKLRDKILKLDADLKQANEKHNQDNQKILKIEQKYNEQIKKINDEKDKLQDRIRTKEQEYNRAKEKFENEIKRLREAVQKIEVKTNEKITASLN